MGSPSTPYSLLSLLWACRGPFSLFHIIYCPWFAFSLFSGFFKPIYLLKAQLFFLSLGFVIHYSCRLGLMSFLSICQTLFCLCCWASSSHLGFQNGPQHLAPWTYEAFLQFICEWKTFLPFLSFLFIFLRGFISRLLGHLLQPLRQTTMLKP